MARIIEVKISFDSKHPNMEPIQRPQSKQHLPSHAKRVFEGEIFDVYQWEQVMYDGSTQTFERLKRDDTVVIIPTLADARILIVDEEQPGRSPALTMPAGRIEKDEEPLDAAKRELLEETGYASEEWVLYKAYQPVMKIEWCIYVFIARNCRKIAEQNLDAGEKIEIQTITLDELIALVQDPRFGTEELRVELTQARYDKEARASLEKIFFG